MSEWVKASHCKPPTSMSVLIAIIERNDKGYFMSSQILAGCYSDELEEDYEGWFIDTFNSQKRFIENKNFKVEAWTLLPLINCPDSLFIKEKI